MVEERKTLRRSNSISGKLANLSIGKQRSPRLRQKQKEKKGLTRSVSFSDMEKEVFTFEDPSADGNDATDVETSFDDGAALDLQQKSSLQLSPTSVCCGDPGVTVSTFSTI